MAVSVSVKREFQSYAGSHAGKRMYSP
jgi:hypothetical protein